MSSAPVRSRRRAPARPLLAALLVLAGVLGGAPAARAAKKVFVVGDSLEVGTGPYLKRQLSGVSVRIDAEVGRFSTVGVSHLRAGIQPDDDVIVFDLGVNDGPGASGQLARSLSAAGSIAGDRCLVVATLSRPPSMSAMNSVVERFAASRANTEVVDWRGAVASRPGLVGGDGVHPVGNGYAYRAGLVADGVRSCLAGGSGTSASDAPSSDGADTPSLDSAPTAKAAPKPKPKPLPPAHLGKLRRYRPLFAAVVVGALMGPPADFQVIRA